jgi:hypothetical protein
MLQSTLQRNGEKKKRTVIKPLGLSVARKQKRDLT